MTTVELTKKEVDIVVDCLFSHVLCNGGCYCDYKTDICNKRNKQGQYRCALQRNIENISKKLGIEHDL